MFTKVEIPAKPFETLERQRKLLIEENAALRFANSLQNELTSKLQQQLETSSAIKKGLELQVKEQSSIFEQISRESHLIREEVP